MYIPKAFAEPDIGRAHQLIDEYSFGMLIAVGNDGDLEIAHLPFLLERSGPFGVLRAHVARANPLSQRLDRGVAATAVFQGPHAYITPRWYEAPQENVPTWNYAVVHAHGTARRIGDDESRQVVDELAARYERAAPSPWSLATLSPGRADQLLPAIMSFALPIRVLEVKFKLGQNRSPVDRDGIRAGLRARGATDDREMLRWMDEGEENDVL